MDFRNRTIAWLVLALVPAFGMTGGVTRLYRQHERTLASEWAERAELARRRGDASGAVRALQSALRFAPGQRGYTFLLATALIEAGRPTEARAYLRTLWESEPGNGPVNLQLGRLAVRELRTEAAARYYRNAIEGSWTDDPEQSRRLARLELVRYLLAQDEPALAQAELIPLAAELPPDPDVAAEVGRMLIASGAPDRARGVFESLLKAGHRQPAVLIGAGDAAFATGDYSAAARHLERALTAGVSSPAVKERATIARAVGDSDPYQPRLTTSARSARTRAAFDRAAALAERCEALAARRSDLQSLDKRLTPRALRRDAELVDEAMEMVFRMEAAAAEPCRSVVTPADTALLLIGRRRFGS